MSQVQQLMKQLESSDVRTLMELLATADRERADLAAALVTELGTTKSKPIKAAAIYLLGRHRLSAGVPELIKNIDFDAADLPVPRREPLWERYPAMEALITIGLPSIQPTVDLLAIEENDLRRALAVRVIRYVEGPDVALFVLEKAMSSETDAKRKSMLADAYARMQKLVNQTR